MPPLHDALFGPLSPAARFVALIFWRAAGVWVCPHRGAFSPTRFAAIHDALHGCEQNFRRATLLGGTTKVVWHWRQVTGTGTEELPDGPIDVLREIVAQT